MDKEAIRRRLESLLLKTETAENLEAGGWWVGDVAGERRTLDDLSAGRLAWRTAHRNARTGLEALEADEIEKAELYAWSATDLYIEALETRVRPSDLEVLARSARRRGKKPKT